MDEQKNLVLDVDENPEVSNKYQIQSIPTLKVFKDGQDVDTVVGFLPKDQIKALIEKHI